MTTAEVKSMIIYDFNSELMQLHCCFCCLKTSVHPVFDSVLTFLQGDMPLYLLLSSLSLLISIPALALFLSFVVWILSAVCSLAANPFNARFHSTLFKPAAHTHHTQSYVTLILCVWGVSGDLFWNRLPLLPIGTEVSHYTMQEEFNLSWAALSAEAEHFII